MKDKNTQNLPKINVGQESDVKFSFLKKAGQKHYWIASGAIVAIMIFHFVFQFSFIQNESFRKMQNLPNIGQLNIPEQVAENIEIPEMNESEAAEEPEMEEAKPETEVATKSAKPEIKKPRTVSPPAQNPSKSVRPRKNIKRNVPQPETRAERLRRAEKILTGV